VGGFIQCAAYFTVGEIFSLEVRAIAIAVFYAIGTLVGGVSAPLFFAFIIETNSRFNAAAGWAAGSALMVAEGLCEKLIGVKAAGKGRESVPNPSRASTTRNERASSQPARPSPLLDDPCINSPLRAPWEWPPSDLPRHLQHRHQRIWCR
jgi:MFS family permease